MHSDSPALGLRFCDWPKPLRGMGSFYSLVLNPSEEGGLSKTGLSDEGMLWDVPYLGWVPKVIERFSVGMASTRKIFLFSYPQFLREMITSVERSLLPRLVPYQARHSVASWDRMNSYRDQLQNPKTRQVEVNVLNHSLRESGTGGTGLPATARATPGDLRVLGRLFGNSYTWSQAANANTLASLTERVLLKIIASAQDI